MAPKSKGATGSLPEQVSNNPGKALGVSGAAAGGAGAATDSGSSTTPAAAPPSGSEIATDPSAWEQLAAFLSSSPWIALAVASIFVLLVSLFYDL